MRKIVSLLLILGFFVFGCSLLCQTPKSVFTTLDTVVTQTKATVDMLEVFILQLQTYDPVIELAYTEAKALLALAVATQKEKCPASSDVDALVTSQTKLQLLVAKAQTRAQSLGLKR